MFLLLRPSLSVSTPGLLEFLTKQGAVRKANRPDGHHFHVDPGWMGRQECAGEDIVKRHHPTAEQRQCDLSL
jgi:hypothetical protein